MKYNLYFHCSENTAFYIFTAVKYSFFKICIIFNQYFSIFHYFVYNNIQILVEMAKVQIASRKLIKALINKHTKLSSHTTPMSINDTILIKKVMRSENIAGPEHLASLKLADLDLHCFPNRVIWGFHNRV